MILRANGVTIGGPPAVIPAGGLTLTRSAPAIQPYRFTEGPMFLEGYQSMTESPSTLKLTVHFLGDDPATRGELIRKVVRAFSIPGNSGFTTIFRDENSVIEGTLVHQPQVTRATKTQWTTATFEYRTRTPYWCSHPATELDSTYQSFLEKNVNRPGRLITLTDGSGLPPAYLEVFTAYNFGASGSVRLGVSSLATTVTQNTAYQYSVTITGNTPERGTGQTQVWGHLTPQERLAWLSSTNFGGDRPPWAGYGNSNLLGMAWAAYPAYPPNLLTRPETPNVFLQGRGLNSMWARFRWQLAT